MSTRRRHNAVLRCLADWLEDGNAQDLVRDQPLYKNPWTCELKGLTKKSRAPDCIGRLGNTVVVVEVSVVAPSKVDSVRREKIEKYQDLAAAMLASPSVQAMEDPKVLAPLVVILDSLGRIPETTQEDITTLASLMYPNNEAMAQAEAQRCCRQMQAWLGPQ